MRRPQVAEELIKRGSHRLAEDSSLSPVCTGQARPVRDLSLCSPSVHREVKASFILQVRPILSSPAPPRLRRNAFCPGRKHLDPLHRFTKVHLLVSALHPERAAPPRLAGVQQWLPGEAPGSPGTAWHTASHPLRWAWRWIKVLKTVLPPPSPNPNIPGCTLAFELFPKI